MVCRSKKNQQHIRRTCTWPSEKEPSPAKLLHFCCTWGRELIYDSFRCNVWFPPGRCRVSFTPLLSPLFTKAKKEINNLTWNGFPHIMFKHWWRRREGASCNVSESICVNFSSIIFSLISTCIKVYFISDSGRHQNTKENLLTHIIMLQFTHTQPNLDNKIIEHIFQLY